MEKGRLLIVEDDNDVLTALALFFEDRGYNVATAKRGHEALTAARTRVPHMVLLDIKLPDIDGLEVFRALRDSPRTRHVPVIFLTQRDERSNKLEGLELGADDYITKPFDVEEVMWRVEKSVRSARRSANAHSITNLPAGALIEEHLAAIRKAGRRGALLYFDLSSVSQEPVDDLLLAFADILGETVETYGTPGDFIGQPADHKFVVSTIPETAPVICRAVSARFNQELQHAARLTCTQVQL